MTIYTDRVTGKKYDRVHGGVRGMDGLAECHLSCRDCALYTDFTQCARGVEHCISATPSKAVFFVFKERKA